jgi:hypothetical protein
MLYVYMYTYTINAGALSGADTVHVDHFISAERREGGGR